MDNNAVWLNEEQREQLKEFIANGDHKIRLLKRAQVLLALDQTGKEDRPRIGWICKEIDISRQSLNVIRKAFFESADMKDFLTRKQRKNPPLPAKITDEVEARIAELACGNPPEGRKRWTVQMLCDKAVELNYLDSISSSTIHKLLKRRGIDLKARKFV